MQQQLLGEGSYRVSKQIVQTLLIVPLTKAYSRYYLMENTRMKNSQKGFTLIELLVVVAIIGILAAIAIPQFSEYRARGYDARAKTDLRNVATAEEAYFADNEVYKACTEANCAALLPGISSLSDGVDLTITLGAGGDFFTGESSHSKGTKTAGGAVTEFCWNSQTGGLVDCP